MSEKVKVYITKYALDEGILESELERDGKGYEWYVLNDYPISAVFGEYHYSKKEAVAMAESMRRNRIASLQKQIKALEREYHYSKKEAIAMAESMRRNKIASLQKQIKALEQIKFD